MRCSAPLWVARVVLPFAAMVLSAGVCWAGHGRCGYRYHAVRPAHHYVHPRVGYHHVHRSFRAYPAYHYARHHYHVPRYRHSCGYRSVNFYVARSYASPFATCRVPLGHGGYRYPVYGSYRYGCYPRYYGFRYGWGWGSPYGVYYSPRTNFVDYRLPTVYYPAELGYGPQAVKQFMGVDRNFALGPLTYTAYDATKDAGTAILAKPAVDVKPATPVSNARTLALARRYVDFGDARFRAQQYHEATQRYKTAVATAPGLAESHIKLGLTSAVTGKYETAVRSIARGLELDPDWPGRGFALDDIYGDGRAAKIGHLEAFARTVLADKHNTQALYLLGVFMYLDGHKDRAQKILQRAADLTGDDEAIRPFTDGREPLTKVASVHL